MTAAAGVTFYVAVGPQARPASLPELLRARGLKPGWGWMPFRRDTAPLASRETTLRVVEVHSASTAAAFARVVRESHGLAPGVEPLLAGARDRGWSCWLAPDGDQPVGAAGSYTSECVGYLILRAGFGEHAVVANWLGER